MKNLFCNSIFVAALVFLLAISAGATAANPQIKNAANVIQFPSCQQLWDEASAEAAKGALDRARVETGAAPESSANRWSERWMDAWKAAWHSHASSFKPGQELDCCHGDWFEAAALRGKSAWPAAWQSAPLPAGQARVWSEKFAATYANEWAKVWFLYFPWLCAKAHVAVAVDVKPFAQATAAADAFAWALAVARSGWFTYSWEESFATAWGTAESSAWAEAGAAATATASAEASASAAAAAYGSCAYARANACAQAAAEAFASAWATAGAAAFADAYAETWTEAYAYAFARAWARANATAAGFARARAFAKAIAEASASAFAEAFRIKLADEGQLPKIVAWWTTDSAPKPELRKIEQRLARAQDSIKKTLTKQIVSNPPPAFKLGFASAFAQASAEAEADASAFASAWVDTWAHSWARTWAESWAMTYIAVCRRAAAAACANCPCTTTTGTLPPNGPGTTTTEPNRSNVPENSQPNAGELIRRARLKLEARRQREDGGRTQPQDSVSTWNVGVVVPAQASGPISGIVTTDPKRYQGIPGLRVTEIPISLAKGGDGKPSLSGIMVDTGSGALQPADGPVTFPGPTATVALMRSGDPSTKVSRNLTVQQRAPLPPSRSITTSPVSLANGVGVIHAAGRLSGDSRKILVALNDEPLATVAANGDAIFFEVPPGTAAGAARLTVADGRLAASAPFTVLKLDTSVDQRVLQKHQWTEGHVALQADGIPAEAWSQRGEPDPDLVDVSEIGRLAPDLQTPQAGQPGFILLAIRNLSPERISIKGWKGPAKVVSLKKNALPFNENLRIQAKTGGDFEINVVAQPFLAQVEMVEFPLCPN